MRKIFRSNFSKWHHVIHIRIKIKIERERERERERNKKDIHRKKQHKENQFLLL